MSQDLQVCTHHTLGLKLPARCSCQMSNWKDNIGDETTGPESSGTPQSGQNAPLVIVTERGRHSDESRRIVRAQAARASAAQSRMTRARNREGREGLARESHQSPGFSENGQNAEPSGSEAADDSGPGFADRPLLMWLATTMGTSTSSLLENVVGVVSTNPMSPGGLVGGLSAAGSFGTATLGSALGSIAGVGLHASDPGRLQLPLAMPRGFAALQQRIDISGDLAVLLSRTSCFDFGSPGVEERLQQLLSDLIVGHAKAILSPIPTPGHPIQGHLRIACTCLTIFQGQRADGAVFTENSYQTGLDAAWSEATLLDQAALADSKSADASLWAIFIINVTTGSTTEFYHRLLHQLLQDLDLRYWSQVRSTLLNFIYPVSFLDEPCKSFFENLQQSRIEGS